MVESFICLVKSENCGVVLTSELTFSRRELTVFFSELRIAVWRFAILGYKAKSLDSDTSVLLY